MFLSVRQNPRSCFYQYEDYTFAYYCPNIYQLIII